jgi:hypothetical protein
LLQQSLRKGHGESIDLFADEFLTHLLCVLVARTAVVERMVLDTKLGSLLLNRTLMDTGHALTLTYPV